MTTNKEAIEELKILKEDYWEDDGYGYATAECQEAITAIDMAIEALEQQPCEDCISRQEAINCVTLNEFRYKIVEDIKILPSVTPKEKTAAWVPTDEEPHEIYECNACGWLLYANDRTDFKYCPNCGARMVSE